MRRREGFDGQILYRLPVGVRQRMAQSPFTRDFVVTDLGYFPEAPGHYVERAEGVEQEILLFVKQGRGFCQVEGREYRLGEREVMLIPAGTAHLYGAASDAPWALYWIHFEGAGAAGLMQWLALNAGQPTGKVELLAGVAREFHQIFEVLQRGYSQHALLSLSRFLITVLITLHRNAVTDERRVLDERIERAMNQMIATVEAPQPLAVYARTAGYSVAQFSKRFYERVGASPMKFLMELRIQRACEYLDGTTLSIQEVGYRLGYEDPFYFSRVFKRETGMSPSHWRAREV